MYLTLRATLVTTIRTNHDQHPRAANKNVYDTTMPRKPTWLIARRICSANIARHACCVARQPYTCRALLQTTKASGGRLQAKRRQFYPAAIPSLSAPRGSHLPKKFQPIVQKKGNKVRDVEPWRPRQRRAVVCWRTPKRHTFGTSCKPIGAFWCSEGNSRLQLHGILQERGRACVSPRPDSYVNNGLGDQHPTMRSCALSGPTRPGKHRWGQRETPNILKS